MEMKLKLADAKRAGRGASEIEEGTLGEMQMCGIRSTHLYLSAAALWALSGAAALLRRRDRSSPSRIGAFAGASAPVLLLLALALERRE